MKTALTVLKRKRVWIPLVLFLMLFFSIAAVSYFLSKALIQTAQDVPNIPFGDIVTASIDPAKRKHLQKAEVDYFAAEKHAALRDYRLARAYFADSSEEFAAAMGVDSPVACAMLIRQAEFEAKFSRWNDAEATLRRALKNLPQKDKTLELSFTVNRWLGYVLQRHGKYSEAIPILLANVATGQLLDRAKHSETEENRRVALQALSSCYVSAKQYDDAINASKQIIEIAQKLPDGKSMVADGWIELGRIKTYTGQYPEAIEYYNKALAVDAKYKEAYRMRGIAHSEIKKQANAISDFSLIIQLDDKDDNAYQWRAYVYELIGEREKAISDLTQSIKLSSDDSSSYDNRARLLAGAGRYKEAIADYCASINVDDNPWTHMYRGQAYEELAQHKEAIDDFSVALESKYFVRHPNREGLHNAKSKGEKTMGALVYDKRADCYAAMGQNELAEADRSKGKTLDATTILNRPKHPDVEVNDEDSEGGPE